MTQWWIYALIVNAILGISTFEYVWANSKHYMKPIKELNDLLPAYRRTDAQNWSKWRFYIGAAFFLYPRLTHALLYKLWHCLCVKIIMCGHDTRYPVTGFRKWCLKWESRACALTWLAWPVGVVSLWEEVPPEKVNYYEEWLGTREEQKEEQETRDERDCQRIPKRGPGNVSTVVANH